MKTIIFLLSLIILSTALGKTASPESVGMSSEKLERTGPMMDSFIEQKGTPGAVTLIARHGKIIHLEGHGKFRDDKDEAMTTDGIFGIASMTKPISHVAVMMLVEEGELLLNDDLADYLPAFRKVQVKLPSGELVPPKAPIKIHHLLTHTSGLASGKKRWTEFATTEDYIQYRAEQPLLFHPGEHYKYPESTDALGWLIEKVSGKSLRQFFMERIFEPLGMKDTDYGIPAEKKRREVIVYRNGKSSFIPPDSSQDPKSFKAGKYFNSSASLYSTAEDYWKFCQMLLNEGEYEGRRLISRTTFRRMMNYTKILPDLEGNINSDSEMNLGFGMVASGGDTKYPFSAGSFYKGGARGTWCFVDPKEGIIGIVMIQTRDRNWRAVWEFFELAYSAISD